MRIVIATAAVTAVLLAASVQAQSQPQPRLQPINCGNAATQTDMNLCADQAYRKSDADLNEAYRTVMKRLKDDATKTTQLQSAQKAWLFFRDAECAFSSSGTTGGSVYPMVLSQCLDTLTQARTKELRAYLKCEEGDMSCPVPGEK
ncbi:lysozyme inhibitor LprI family protein [Achromobacter spanius]|uniref:lysozyme inhibitor LprI family protein n=1 Tax=Achromobacter spanius TaxID=217203 RepID=UPI0036E7D270